MRWFLLSCRFVLHLLLLVFVFPMGVILLCELGFLRRCDLGFDVTVVLMMCWLGLVWFGFWLVSLLAQVSHHGFT